MQMQAVRISIARAQALLEAGDREALIRWLRCCRCRQLETLHETQKQLDRLDLLIRKAQQMKKGEKGL